MNAYTLALKAHDLARETQGFTIDAMTGESPTEGFVVGGVVPEVRIPWTRLSSYGIEDFILANKHNLLDGYCFLGGWVDGEELVLDVCSIERDATTADKIARSSGQKAFYSLHDKETIFV